MLPWKQTVQHILTTKQSAHHTMFGYRSEIAFCITLLLISLTFMAFRLYIRYCGGSGEKRVLKRSPPYLIGDLFMVVGWVLSASYGFAHVYFRVHQVRDADAAKSDPKVAMSVMLLSMKVRILRG